jgi:nucleoside-diphosphate-sugar epimerase
MKRKILLTGSLGQIGSEIALKMQEKYGEDQVVVSDVRKTDSPLCKGLFEEVDVTDPKRIAEVVNKHNINYVVHLASLLSAVGEKNPQLLWHINMSGLYNVLEIAREKNLGVFIPSSIAAFGPGTPQDKTPQDTILRPSTIYGVSKVAGELLCDYYAQKYGLDIRGVRFPGLISYTTLPGGGTTDYAVSIYYDALKTKSFKCGLKAGTYMPMMYMPDALNAIVQLIEADSSKLLHRNAFNITAMSFDPEGIAASIKKIIPEFKLEYDLNPTLQKIADSWPNSLDDSAARKEWGWNPKYDLDTMSADMITNLKKLGYGG